MNAIKTTPHKQGHGSQEWTVIVGANTMVNPETVMQNNGDCWRQFNGQSWKLWRDNGDLRLQEILHTKGWCQTVVCLPHMMISRIDMPTTSNDLTQWYAYHIQCYHTVIYLPHMISHSAMPTTYDLTPWLCLPHMIWQWYAYHIWYNAVLCLPHDMPTTYDITQWYAYHMWYHTVICLPHTMVSCSDMPTTYDDITQWYSYHIEWSHAVICLPQSYHMICLPYIATIYFYMWQTYHTQWWSQCHTYHTQWWSQCHTYPTQWSDTPTTHSDQTHLPHTMIRHTYHTQWSE